MVFCALAIRPYELDLAAQTAAKSSSNATGSGGASINTGRTLLAKEPEIKAAGGLIDSWQAEQGKSSSDPTRQSNGQLALGGYVSIRNRMVIIDRLEERLQQEVVQCHFCSDKQAELTELLREELAWEHVYGEFGLRTYDPIGDRNNQMADNLRAHYGMPKPPENPEQGRWATLNVGYQEAGDIMKWHCRILHPEGGRQLESCQSENSFGDYPTTPVFEISRSHEKAWASCFQSHNWASEAGQRLLYERCMEGADPLTKLCIADRKADSGLAEHYCPQSFVVHVSDVSHLLNWNDRYAGHAPKPWVAADPAKAMVEVIPEHGLGLEVTLLDPVLMRPQNEVVSIRGQLARNIIGTSLGIDGAIIAVAKGTPVILQVRCYQDGANVYLVRLALPNGANADFKNQVKSFPAHPPAGYPGIPVPGDVIKYERPFETRFLMLKSEFDRKAKEYSAALGLNVPGSANSNGDLRHRRIYARTVLSVTALQDIDLDSARAGTVFRARLEAISDSEPSAHPDALNVAKGAEIDVRVTAKPSDIRPYIVITASADHLVAYGLNIPVLAKPNIFQIAGKEKQPDSSQQQRSGNASGSSIPLPVGGIFGRAQKQLGGIAGQYPKSSVPASGNSAKREPAYENATVIRAGTAFSIYTSEDTFVADATPATQTKAQVDR